VAKFRKKPVIIEAEQWFPGKRIDGVVLSGNPDDLREQIPVVVTLEGAMRVSSGDWIITGVAGERYPCKPQIFEATYEAVDV
jgi:hypothetical protein